MLRFFRRLLNGLVRDAVNCLVDIFLAILVLLEFLACAYWGYQWVFAPMAATPGARDGLGLLFVGTIILVGVIAVAGALAGATLRACKSLLPWWTPVLFDDF